MSIENQTYQEIEPDSKSMHFNGGHTVVIVAGIVDLEGVNQRYQDDPKFGKPLTADDVIGKHEHDQTEFSQSKQKIIQELSRKVEKTEWLELEWSESGKLTGSEVSFENPKKLFDLKEGSSIPIITGLISAIDQEIRTSVLIWDLKGYMIDKSPDLPEIEMIEKFIEIIKLNTTIINNLQLANKLTPLLESTTQEIVSQHQNLTTTPDNPEDAMKLEDLKRQISAYNKSFKEFNDTLELIQENLDEVGDVGKFLIAKYPLLEDEINRLI